MGMMWTTENRPRYNRDKLRYPSDLTDEEWGHLEHLIPPAKRGGRRREIDEREVVNGLLYILSTGCQWRYIPRDLPPRSTLFDYFQRWEYDGTLLRIHYELYQKCRELVDRQASPTACVIDSQSVKSAEKGGAHIDPSGYDAGKKINGKKRHIVVDTEGLLMHAVVHPADVQERDGGILVLTTRFGLYPFLKKLFADGGYQSRNSARNSPSCCLGWPLKSSNVRIRPRASRFCPDAGSSNELSPGSTGVVDWRRISRTGPVTHSHSLGWPLFV